MKHTERLQVDALRLLQDLQEKLSQLRHARPACSWDRDTTFALAWQLDVVGAMLYYQAPQDVTSLVGAFVRPAQIPTYTTR